MAHFCYFIGLGGARSTSIAAIGSVPPSLSVDG